MPQKFAIPITLAEKILNTLGQRPYVEVSSLISEITQQGVIVQVNDETPDPEIGQHVVSQSGPIMPGPKHVVGSSDT